jgi:hypothetical protein
MLHSAPMPSAAILSERRRRGPGDCFAARNEMHSLYMRSFVWPRDRRVYCDLAAGDEGVGGWMDAALAFPRCPSTHSGILAA